MKLKITEDDVDFFGDFIDELEAGFKCREMIICYCVDNELERPVPVLCRMVPTPSEECEDGIELFDIIPMARVFDNNPYEVLAAPPGENEIICSQQNFQMPEVEEEGEVKLISPGSSELN